MKQKNILFLAFITAMNVDCSSSKPFPYLNGYKCCETPVSDTGIILEWWGDISMCPVDKSELCPGLPTSVCRAKTLGKLALCSHIWNNYGATLQTL